MLTIPNDVLHICTILNKHDYDAYVVGGAVRDVLLNLNPEDWDITTNALPEEIQRIFPHTIPTGQKYGTISVKQGQTIVEVTTMREDANYSDGRRPDFVKFTSELVLDLQRRDFTVNAMAYNPLNNQLIDTFNGMKDLKKRILRTVGSSEQRFREDALRMLRLARFSATLGFKPHPTAVQALEPSLLQNVANERIQSELSKLLVGKNTVPALKLLYSSGMLDVIMPELAETAHISQGNRHRWDVLHHSFMTTQNIKPVLHLRLAALLHDIGKAATLSVDDQGLHFYQHELVGAEITKKILRRLRYSLALQDKVALLVKEHMFQIHPHSTDKAIRRFIARVGIDNIYDLIELRKADILAMRHNPKHTLEYYQAMLHRIDTLLAEKHVFTTKDLAITGSDLIKELNLSPGPIIGEILNHLLEVVLDNPDQNSPKALMQIAKEKMPECTNCPIR